MIDPLAMPIFKPLWEAFPYLPGCFAAWRGMSLGEISASAYAAADGERRPSDAIVDCMAKHAARSLGNDVGEAVKRYFSRNSAVLSANLHGIDCLPEMVQAVWFFGLNRLAGGTPGAVIPRAVLRRRVPAKFGIPARAAILPRGRPGTVPAVPEFLAGYRGTECPRLGRKGRTFKCRPLEADQGL